MTTLGRRLARDDGESLIELTMAIMILGVVVVAIGACIAFTAKASGIHRNQALADQYLHNNAELLQSSYMGCDDPSLANTSELTSKLQSYYLGKLSAPPGAFPSVTTPTVSYWNGTAFVESSTCPANDPGLQQITLNLTSAAGHVNESLVVVVRQS